MRNYEIFEKLELDYAPVAVKFAMTKPKDLPQLEGKFAFCEMLKTAQNSESGFWTDKSNHACGVGPYVLGQVDEVDPGMIGGMIGPRINVYEDTRGNRNVYTNMHTFPKGTAPYTWFAPLKNCTFKPDLVILVASVDKAEIVLRANGYYTGDGWNAYGTTVAGCGALFARPFFTGELNMMVTGLHHGMKARKTFPQGLLILSIPYQVLPRITDALNEMMWDLPQYSWGAENHVKYMRQIGQQIAEDLKA